MTGKDPSNENCLYFDISKQERDSAVRYLLGSIIKTRQSSAFPSNYYVYDEDVNVYMAHLLFAVSLPEYHEMADPYLSLSSSDILKWVRQTEDRTIRYFIFKVNADRILMHTAIFDDLSGSGPKKIFTRSQRHYRELAKLYYDQASAYHKRIYRRKTGVGDVLQKLSDYFDSYQSLLKNVRKDYFQFMNGFRDQAFSQFMNQLNSHETEESKKILMDRFLEIYGEWLETKDPELLRQVQVLSERLKKVDPSFNFDPTKNNIYPGEDHGEQRKCA